MFNMDEEFAATASYCVYAGGLIHEGKLSATVSASSTSGSTAGSARVRSWSAPDTAGSSTSSPGSTSRARHTAAHLRRERLGRARLRRNRRVRERGVNRGWRTVTVTGRAVESGDVSDGVDGRNRRDDGFEAARCRQRPPRGLRAVFTLRWVEQAWFRDQYNLPPFGPPRLRDDTPLRVVVSVLKTDHDVKVTFVKRDIGSGGRSKSTDHMRSRSRGGETPRRNRSEFISDFRDVVKAALLEWSRAEKTVRRETDE